VPWQKLRKLSALIGAIYDAALDPTLWPKVLPKSAQFVGGRAAALFYKDAASKSGDVAYDCGIDRTIVSSTSTNI
jgi:hypothetical protein